MQQEGKFELYGHTTHSPFTRTRKNDSNTVFCCQTIRWRWTKLNQTKTQATKTLLVCKWKKVVCF